MCKVDYTETNKISFGQVKYMKKYKDMIPTQSFQPKRYIQSNTSKI